MHHMYSKQLVQESQPNLQCKNENESAFLARLRFCIADLPRTTTLVLKLKAAKITSTSVVVGYGVVLDVLKGRPKAVLGNNPLFYHLVWLR
jgi:hypothetical protein